MGQIFPKTSKDHISMFCHKGRKLNSSYHKRDSNFAISTKQTEEEQEDKTYLYSIISEVPDELMDKNDKVLQRLLNIGQGSPSHKQANNSGTEFYQLDKDFHVTGKIDNKLNLRKHEIYRLKASWKAVHRAVAKTGLDMFIEVFRSNEVIIKFFEKNTEMKIENGNIEENVLLANHAEGVMKLLDLIILSIDDEKKVDNLIKKYGKFHHKFDGFKAEFFLIFEEPFLKATRITLEDRYSEDIGRIYATVIRFILTSLKDRFLDTE